MPVPRPRGPTRRRGRRRPDLPGSHLENRHCPSPLRGRGAAVLQPLPGPSPLFAPPRSWSRKGLLAPRLGGELLHLRLEGLGLLARRVLDEVQHVGPHLLLPRSLSRV